MSYGIKYQINFARFTDDLPGLINILLKDYAGPVITVEGANSPIKISYKSGDYYANDPIRGSEADISFYNNGSIDLSDFDGYDNNCRVDYYLNSVLTWSGFLSLDDCSEDMQALPNIISLRATDGLGLLKDIPFTDESGALIYSQQSILTIFKYCLYYTYLQLPTNIYVNIFEAGMQDKGVSNTKEPFSQAFIDCKTFLITQNSQQELNDSLNPVLLIDKVKNCYDILSVILKDWGCTLYQANGCWNITRWFELKDNNNVIPGVQYDATFTTPSVAPNINLTAISNSNPVKFIGAGQRKYLVRGNNYINAQFDYKQTPFQILNNDLMILGALQRSYTVNSWGYGPYIKGVTYLVKEYAFPDWTINGYTGFTKYPPYIRVIWDSRDNLEIERYLVMDQYETRYGPYNLPPNVQLNDVLVSQNDRFDFSFNWRSDAGVTNTEVAMAVNLKLPDGTYYALFWMNIRNQNGYFKWLKSASPSGGIVPTQLSNDGVSMNTFQLSSLIQQPANSPVSLMPPFPANGWLQIQIAGFNVNPAKNHLIYINGITLTVTNYINNSLTTIIGDYHQSNQIKNIRKYLNKSLTISDAPSVSIQGAMFLGDGLTLTKSWYRGNSALITGTFSTYSASGNYTIPNQISLNGENDSVIAEYNYEQKITFSNLGVQGGTYYLTIGTNVFTSTYSDPVDIVNDFCTQIAAATIGSIVLAENDGNYMILYYITSGSISVDWKDSAGDSQGSTVSGTLVAGVQYSLMAGCPRDANVTIMNHAGPMPGYTFNIPGETYQFAFSLVGLPPLPAGSYTVRVNNYGNLAIGRLFHYWQTIEWMWLTDSTRTKIDASFQGDTDSNGLIGLGNVFTVDELPGKYFILGQCEFDCQDQSWNGTLEEVWNTSDTFLESMFTNIFNYLYQQS